MRVARSALVTLAALGLPVASLACSGSSGSTPSGQTDFVSAPAGGAGGGAGLSDSFGGSGAGAPTASTGAMGANAPTPKTPPQALSNRTVQETDLYRLEGTRLYYLNSYRGLMVFDVSDVDHPKLLGRSPIFGSPVDMIVQNSVAVVVVGDWYGTLDNGSPFHGSIVRGLDATDPTNIKVVGDAKLGGWVQEDRVVGNVLYAVSQDEGWVYGWAPGGPVSVSNGGGVSGGVAIVGPGSTVGGGSNVIVSSVSFGGGQIKQVASKTYAGYGGVFAVTPSSILLAHPDVPPQPTGGAYVPTTQTDLQYLDITDPGGNIVERGKLTVDGVIDTSSADSGRWNLDFADGATAHVIGSENNAGSTSGTSYILATASFSNPDQPTVASQLTIPSPGWNAVARFDTGRMYLSPDASYYYGGPNGTPTTTPLQVFDLSNPAAPALAGQTQLPGNVWLMIPSGNQLFALGTAPSQNAQQVALTYLDVTNAAAPSVIGTSAFGEGWASTPASGTFKAFTMDASKGLVVLPFSGWDAASGNYDNGVQLIEFSPTTIVTGGAAHTKGWVERGIFVGKRIVSLSDLALAVVDYSNPLAPLVTAELTLARSVIASQPEGNHIAEVSSDFWDNDVTHSDVRVLPVSDAEENVDESSAVDVTVDGVNAQVFTNGNLDYIVTNVQVPITCPTGSTGGTGGPGTLIGGSAGGAPVAPTAPTPKTQGCTGWQEQVEVVDLSNGSAKPRGKILLPLDPNGYNQGWGWSGIYESDWFDGAPVVQVGGDALAFRRWTQSYSQGGAWVDGASDLIVVDLSNPDAPSVASSVITRDPTGWWGDMTVVGETLYTSHYEWTEPLATRQSGAQATQPTVRYYLDRIDLSDRKHPKIGSKINVPGVLVGGSASDPSVLYTIDSSWDTSTWRNSFDVVRVQGNLAYLQSATLLDGWTGKTLIRGTTAYLSTQTYSDRLKNGEPGMELHQIDLSRPTHPVDRVATGASGWGWLLDVQGDRAMVTSGWGPDGLDVYKLSPTAAPVYDQFIRTRGWSVQSLSRQGNEVFLSSGYWGVEAVALQ